MIRRACHFLLVKTATRGCHHASGGVTSRRTLYSKAALGLDGYDNARYRYSQQFSNEENSFMSTMKEVVDNDEKVVFTDDLKSAIHLAEERDIPLVKDLILKFENQNSEVRFGNFVFGPVILRLFYYLNKPQEALDMFKASKGILDQVVTFQLLMDLLFNNARYQEVIEVFDLVKEKQIQGAKYPRHVVVLALGACYKLNTSESFEYAMNLWSEMIQVGHQPMRRAATFAAALALNQNKPEVALEILSTVRNKGYVTVRNLKLRALARVGRLDEVIGSLEETIAVDRGFSAKVTVCEETVNEVKLAIDQSGNDRLLERFTQVVSKLRSLNQIDVKCLDELLTSEMDKNFNPGFRYEGPQRGPRNQRPPFSDYRTPRYRNYPGLSEMT